MAKVIAKPTITLTATIELTEDEIGALDALSGYGTDNFIEKFYKSLGEAYLSRHEAGIRSLFATVRSELSPQLERVHNTRKNFHAKKSQQD